MTTARVNHTATALQNGQVLVAGGGLASAELYTPRDRQQVLVACGTRGNSPALNSAELYNSATGQWSAAEPGPCNPGFCALDASATLLGTGKVLVAGGFVGRYPNEFTTVGATLYDPATNTWTSTGNMNQGRACSRMGRCWSRAGRT